MIKILEGDCLEVMAGFADGSFDCIITDPPYGMSINLTHRNKPLPTFENEAISGDDHSEWFDTVLKEMHRVIKPDAFVMIWIDFRNYGRVYDLVQKYFTIKNCIVWDKGHFGAGNNFRFQHEFCIFAVKGDYTLGRHDVADVWRVKREAVASYMHMTQKPLDLMKLCISYTGADNILDPFVGSGTTLVAAKELGRTATGVELSTEYAQIARGRLEQGTLL